MSSLNEVNLIGNLGSDPDIKYAANGNAVANLSIATSEKWKDKNSGDQQEKTEWHRVVAFGKLAEIMGQYLKKGSKVYIKGALQTRKWEDKEGVTRYTTEVVCGFGGKMIMLSSNPNSQGRPPAPPEAASPTAVAGQMTGGATGGWFPQDSGAQVAPTETPDFDDDIPF